MHRPRHDVLPPAAPRGAVLFLARIAARTPQLLRAVLAAAGLAALLTASALAHEAPSDRIEELTRRIWQSPADAELYLERGELRRLGRDFEGAEADYARARRLDPDLAAVDLCLGTLRAAQGRDEEARAALDRYLARRPYDVRGLEARARAAMRLGRFLDAAGDWSRAIESARAGFTPPPDWYLERARALAAAGASYLDEARAGLLEGIRRLDRPVSLLSEARALDAAIARARSDGARDDPPLGSAARGSMPLASRRRRAGWNDWPDPDPEPGPAAGDDAGSAAPSSPAIPSDAARAGEGASYTADDADAAEDDAPLVPETVLVQFDGPMRYRANAANPGIGLAWIQETYNDTAWASGLYGVGYETTSGGAIHLLRTNVPSGAYSVYTRAHFTIADLASVGNVFLGADYDDAYVAWINGVEVFRSPEMPAGAPAWNTNAALHESSNGQTPNYAPLHNVSAAALSALHAGDNVLAVGVWNSGAPTSSDLVVVPRLSINKSAALARGPYLQTGTPTSVVVRWRTDTETNSLVRYGASPKTLTSTASSAAAVLDHVVALGGLSPATRYFYSVGSSSTVYAGGDDKTAFTTSPAAGTKPATRVWVIGDSGTANADARAVRDAYAAFTGPVPTDLSLMLGDNAYIDGSDAEYQAAVFDLYPDMLRRSVLWPTLGNHDGHLADSTTQTGPYYDVFTLPAAAQAGGVVSGTEAYYSFDYGNIHFICLDSFDSSRAPGGAMMTWLQSDLAATSKDWTIAFWHHPPYSKGSHDSDVEIELMEMRQNALPLLEARGVDLVLSGHSHSYERSFFIDGHYGLSSSFSDAYKVMPGGGSTDTGGVYAKPQLGPDAHEGAVYAVAGSSGQIDTSGTLDHPAMYASLGRLGSMALDVRGNRLEAFFLDSTGAVADRFTIVKGPALAPSADFVGAPLSGPAPLVASFVDRSTNGPTSWAWDFTDDGTADSGAANPSWLYSTPGLRPVTLRASNGAGSNQKTRAGYVCVTAGAAAPSIAGLRVASDRQTLTWTAQAPGTTYDVVKGNLTSLRASGGDFASSLTACLASGSSAATASDALSPAAGQGFYYVARGRDCAAQGGTWDEPGQTGSRDAEIAAAPASCP